MKNRMLPLALIAMLSFATAQAQDDADQDTTTIAAADKIPFAGQDQSWQNGADRRTEPSPLQGKFFTGSIMVDVNYPAHVRLLLCRSLSSPHHSGFLYAVCSPR